MPAKVKKKVEQKKNVSQHLVINQMEKTLIKKYNRFLNNFIIPTVFKVLKGN